MRVFLRRVARKLGLRSAVVPAPCRWVNGHCACYRRTKGKAQCCYCWFDRLPAEERVGHTPRCASLL